MNDSIKQENKGPRATIIAALIGAVALILATVITLVFTTGDDKGKNVSITQTASGDKASNVSVGGDVTVNIGTPDCLKSKWMEELLEHKDEKISNLEISLDDLTKDYEDLTKSVAKRAKEDNLFIDVQEKIQACDYPGAEKLVMQSYEKNRKANAEDAYQLAKLKKLQIQYSEAKKYYEEAVRLAPDNALYLGSLGELLLHMADYKESIKYSERALAIDKKAFGDQHPKVAIILNNIGSAWHSLGEYEKAIEYYEMALAVGKKTLGEQHPKIALRLNNIGGAWHSLGEYKKAIGYFEKALVIDKKAFGDQHPDVAIDLNNIGGAWNSLGEYKKAIGYYEKALKIFEDKVGADHPYTKTVKGNMEFAKSMLLMQK